MATLRVLNGSGDRRITWSAKDLANGDAEAQAAVCEAERIFARERGLGAVPGNQDGRKHAEQMLAHGIEEAEILGKQIVDGLEDELQKIGLHQNSAPFQN